MCDAGPMVAPAACGHAVRRFLRGSPCRVQTVRPDVQFSVHQPVGKYGCMNSTNPAVRKSVLSVFAGIMMAALGLSLAGCSTTETTAQAEPPGAVSPGPRPMPAEAITAVTTAPSTASALSTASQGRLVSLHVEGARASALVKTLVVTADGKENGAGMRDVELPFDEELTLPADVSVTKILVLAKYASGAAGKISCAVTIDDRQVASQSSSNHRPAECLVVGKSSQ